MLSSLSLTFSLFFSSPLLSPLSHHPRCNPDQPRCKGELPASFSRRVALPPSSDFPLAYPPARTLPARVFARRLFPSFPFSQSTSNFLDVAQAKRQHRIAQRPAPLAPGFDAEERSLHFYETLRTLRRPVGTDRPSPSPSRSPPFPVLPGFTCYEHSVAAFCSVHRRGIPARQFIRKVFFAFFVVLRATLGAHICASVCICAQKYKTRIHTT